MYEIICEEDFIIEISLAGLHVENKKTMLPNQDIVYLLFSRNLNL